MSSKTTKTFNLILLIYASAYFNALYGEKLFDLTNIAIRQLSV